VTSPTASPESGIIGVHTTSKFSYSEHALVQRGEPGAMSALRRCRSEGGTPAPRDGQLVCVPDTTRPRARLVTRRVLRRGKPLVLSCNEPCAAVATATAQGRRLAGGRGKSESAGRLRVRMRLTAAGRRKLAARRSVRATLRVRVSDRAGNSLRLRRALRLSR
jgi:hypothetical protein